MAKHRSKSDENGLRLKWNEMSRLDLNCNRFESWKRGNKVKTVGALISLTTRKRSISLDWTCVTMHTGLVKKKTHTDRQFLHAMHSLFAVKATMNAKTQIPIRNITIRWVVIIVCALCIPTHDTELLAAFEMVEVADDVASFTVGADRSEWDKHDTVQWDCERVPAGQYIIRLVVSALECVLHSCRGLHYHRDHAHSNSGSNSTKTSSAMALSECFLFGKGSLLWQSVNSFQ